MQYRNGIIISTAAAVDLHLGFVPDKFTVTNYTTTAAQTGVGSSLWINNVVPTGDAIITTYTAGAPVVSQITSNGFTPQSSGGVWTNTIYTITGITRANPGVVTVSSATGLTNGMTFTISGLVTGMTPLNTNRFVIAGLSGTTFNLYDTFGNPVNTLGLTAYVSGGQMDVISTPQTAPVLNPTNGQVLVPGAPPGLQLDTGYYGITLGTGVVGASGNVLFWEAFYATPTGY